MALRNCQSAVLTHQSRKQFGVKNGAISASMYQKRHTHISNYSRVIPFVMKLMIFRYFPNSCYWTDMINS